jgi:hypothetical protein
MKGENVSKEKIVEKTKITKKFRRLKTFFYVMAWVSTGATINTCTDIKHQIIISCIKVNDATNTAWY